MRELHAQCKVVAQLMQRGGAVRGSRTNNAKKKKGMPNGLRAGKILRKQNFVQRGASCSSGEAIVLRALSFENHAQRGFSPKMGSAGE